MDVLAVVRADAGKAGGEDARRRVDAHERDALGRRSGRCRRSAARRPSPRRSRRRSRRRGRPGAASCGGRRAASRRRWRAGAAACAASRTRRRRPWRGPRRADRGCAVRVEEPPPTPRATPPGHVDALDQRVADDERAVRARVGQVGDVDAQLGAVRAAEVAARHAAAAAACCGAWTSSGCPSWPRPRRRAPCCASASRRAPSRRA